MCNRWCDLLNVSDSDVHFPDDSACLRGVVVSAWPSEVEQCAILRGAKVVSHVIIEGKVVNWVLLWGRSAVEEGHCDVPS